LENIEYHQIEPNLIYVLIFTHSFCSEGDLVESEETADDKFGPNAPEM
jgi:hypothetical protein